MIKGAGKKIAHNLSGLAGFAVLFSAYQKIPGFFFKMIDDCFLSHDS
jgi:hypothetical protein